jgi:CheY-like chemotaxis protein
VSLKVLVAEDNIINQRLASIHLKRMGHSGVIVPDGVQALKCLEKSKFDLILMDVMMPNLDGLQTISIIREQEQGTDSRVPILIVSAHDDPAEIRRMVAFGADGFVAKPISIEILAAEISRVAGRFASHKRCAGNSHG